MAENILQEEVWDKKKIVLGIVVAGTILFSAYKIKTLVLDTKEDLKREEKISRQEVEGASTIARPEIDLPTKEDIQEDLVEKVTVIKEEIQRLKLEEVATSSPQVQKIIKDIQSIEDYPKNQARQMCQEICSRF
jgi:hypothetical protein